jgi:ABC-2 type transport system permease protein
MFQGSTSILVILTVFAARFALGRGFKALPRRRGRGPRERAPSSDLGGHGPVALVLHQARYDLRVLVRNTQARTATMMLPLLLLVLFLGMWGTNRVAPGHAEASTYYVPGLVALSVIASSFVNLVVSVVMQRETGVLKRRRAAPIPAWVLIGGRVVTAMIVSLSMATALVTIGWIGFGVALPAEAIPAVILSAVAGSICFCVLAYAVAALIGSAEAAQPMVQAVMLPLYLGSGIFIPDPSLPDWLRQTAALFPVERLADALHQPFSPATRGLGIAWTDLAVLALWAAAGLAVALRRFSWLPGAGRTA